MGTNVQPQSEHPKSKNGNPAPVFVALDDFVPELELNRKAHAYWASLPRELGRAPLKSACDILDMAEILPTCFMLDFEGPTTWPIRLFGTELVFHFGIDATGLNGYDLYSEEDKKLVSERIRILRERSAIMTTHNRLKNATGVTIEAESVFLPLSNEHGEVKQTLVSMEAFENRVEPHEFEMEGTMKNRRLLKLIYATD